MTMTTLNTRLGRAAALGLSAALIGGVSLVAAAPAQAATTDILVYASEIRPDESTYAGWHQGYADAADRASVTAEGLKLTGESQILNGLDESTELSVDTLAQSINAGELSWTTTADSDPAYFQIALTFGDGKWTTLRPSAPVTGTNTASLSDAWVSSKAIGDIAAGSVVSLQALTDALLAEDGAVVNGFGVLTTTGTESTVTGLSFNGAGYVFLQDSVVAGTVTISGTQAVGSTLTAVPAGWAADVTLSYGWGAVAPHQQHSGDIDGANTSTIVVTADMMGKQIWVAVAGHKDGFADSYTSAFLAAPELPIAAPPVADSADLAAFLEANGSTPASQTSTGLPAGALDPTKSYTANVRFDGSDGFVDAYLYSSPISVGTFPVVGGVAQITLSADVLTKLGAGAHTLVVVGQFYGDVSSVSLSVAAVLAATGFDAGVPFGAAVLLLLGGSILYVRRRRMHA